MEEQDADNTELWLTWNDHIQILKGVLYTLRYKGLYADVTLVCGAKHFAVHKFVLSTCSSYFEKLLESIPGHHPVVVLTNTSPKDLEALLDFMYLGQTEVKSQDLDKLLDIAFEFRIRGLINARDDPEKQDQEKGEEEITEKIEADKDVEMTQESDPLNSFMETQDYEEKPKENGPEDAEGNVEGNVEGNNVPVIKNEDDFKSPDEDFKPPEEDFKPPEEDNNPPEEDLKPPEEDRKPPALDSGLKEYQNFIQKMMQQTEEQEAESLEVTPLANIPERPSSTVKKTSKHQDTKSKRGRAKGKIEKFKTDVKKQRERTGKNKTENSKEKKATKPVEDTKTRIMMCPGCKKTFMSQSVLEAHMKTHEDLEIISCSECPYKALSKLQMQKHIITHQQRIELKSRPFRCPYCPARQVDRSSFLRHQKTLHPDKKVVNLSTKAPSEDSKNKRVRQNKINKDHVRS